MLKTQKLFQMLPLRDFFNRKAPNCKFWCTVISLYNLQVDAKDSSCVLSWARKPVNHTSWVALVTPTDRPKSVRNRCLIELFCGVVCVVTLPFWHFCWCRGFCHRTESDLFLFLFFRQILFIYEWNLQKVELETEDTNKLKCSMKATFSPPPCKVFRFH